MADDVYLFIYFFLMCKKIIPKLRPSFKAFFQTNHLKKKKNILKRGIDMLCLPKRIDYKYRLLSGTLAAQFITHLMVVQPHQQFVWNQASVSFMLWTVTETCSIKNASEEWQHNLFLSSKRPPHTLSIQSTGMVKIEREMGTGSARELMKLVFLQKISAKKVR